MQSIHLLRCTFLLFCVSCGSMYKLNIHHLLLFSCNFSFLTLRLSRFRSWFSTINYYTHNNDFPFNKSETIKKIKKILMCFFIFSTSKWEVQSRDMYNWFIFRLCLFQINFLPKPADIIFDNVELHPPQFCDRILTHLIIFVLFVKMNYFLNYFDNNEN